MDINYEKRVGENIRKLRIKNNLTQEQLSARLQVAGCDITRSALAKIEVGQRHIYLDELRAIKNILKEKILDSAIHGTLVENDLSLSPADVGGVDDVPFEIPSNWKWAKLKDVVTINPRNKISDELGVSFLPMTNIDGGYNNSYKAEIIDSSCGFSHNPVINYSEIPCFFHVQFSHLSCIIN